MSFYIYNKVYSGVYHLLSVPPTAESDWSDQLRFLLIGPRTRHSGGCSGVISVRVIAESGHSLYLEKDATMAGRLLLRACTTTLQLRSSVLAPPLHRSMATVRGRTPYLRQET